MAGKLVLTAGGRLSFLPLDLCPQGCLSVLTTGWLGAQREQSQRMSCNFFYNLVLEVIHLYFCNISLVTQVSPIQSGGNLPLGAFSEMENLLGVQILRLNPTPTK